MRVSAPVVVLSALFAAQGAAFYGISRRAEAAPESRPLSEFPVAVGAWRMAEQGSIAQDEKDVLRADDYLTRQYDVPSGKTASLFVALFRTQRAGQTPHSPKNCLPGSGWAWSVSDLIHVNVDGRSQPIEINRYVVSKGDHRAVVLYWYQSRDRVVASEYRAAAFTAFDALRYNRTDTALVRIVVPIAANHTDIATRDGVEFVQAFFTTLRRFLPRQ